MRTWNLCIPNYGCLTVSTPYISPYGYPNDVPGGQKSVSYIFVLIPFWHTSYLTIAGYDFFLGRLRVPTRRCDLVVPADWGWGCSNEEEDKEDEEEDEDEDQEEEERGVREFLCNLAL